MKMPDRSVGMKAFNLTIEVKDARPKRRQLSPFMDTLELIHSWLR
jgi:hypothetical protein